MALALAYSFLMTLSLDELALFVFKPFPSLAHVFTSSYGELGFDFFQALLHLDIVFWRAYLSSTFFKLCFTLTSSFGELT